MSIPIVSPTAYPSQPVVARAGAEPASPDALPSASTGMGRDMVRGFALSLMAAVLAGLVLLTDRLLLERTGVGDVLAWLVLWSLGMPLDSDLDAIGCQELQAAQVALQATPQIQYVAVLADDKADASMLVTFDPGKNSLVLQRVGDFHEAADKSLQLWALPPQGGPQSLGVLGRDKLVKLTAAAAEVQGVPALAISLEPKGGVPSQTGPTGPVLFKGALIRRDL